MEVVSGTAWVKGCCEESMSLTEGRDERGGRAARGDARGGEHEC